MTNETAVVAIAGAFCVLVLIMLYRIAQDVEAIRERIAKTEASDEDDG